MKRRAILLLILTAVLLIAMIALLEATTAQAEDLYVLCRPEAEVNIRERPKLKSRIVACYFFGSQVKTDGEEQNGFLHVIDINGEVSEGWIYKGLVIDGQPVATGGTVQVFNAGRVACRKYACQEAKIQRWLADGDSVRIFAVSEEWTVTEYGYIQTAYLTVNAPVPKKCQNGE